jgi:hypothetical protein
MNALVSRTAPRWVIELLAILSITFFWVLPYSPLLAITAVLATNQSHGWPRKLAVAAAILSAALTIALSVVVLWNAIRVGLF